MKLNLAKISKNSKIAFESKIDSIKKKRVLENFSKLLIRNKNKIFGGK